MYGRHVVVCCSLPSFEEYRQTILTALADLAFVKGFHFLCDIRADFAPNVTKSADF